jgi:hypothetical protein
MLSLWSGCVLQEVLAAGDACDLERTEEAKVFNFVLDTWSSQRRRIFEEGL